MNTPKSVTLTAATVIGLLTMSGCSAGDHAAPAASSASSPTTSTSQAPLPSKPLPTGTTRANPRGMKDGLEHVNRADAAATATAFLTALNAQDTAMDTTPWNAADRAAQLATSSYAAQLRQQVIAAPGAAWNAMSAAKGYTTVAVKQIPADDPPPSSPTEKYLTFQVVVTTHGAKAEPLKSSTFVHLQRATSSAPWQVASSMASYE
ncbi:hypothetical protein [Dermacoccus nishinomiyaensis]|nr:hypothetical protein [Dermacoccus nishinomiyaensis]NHC33039.1 hypothetical protein [Dermacoccus nishinomiyaensis]